MSEPGSPEMTPEERERIVLAQAEIKNLLLPKFDHTALAMLFSENKVTLVDARYRGLRKDFIGNRVVSGGDVWSTDERELKAYLKPQLRVPGKDVGQSIRIVEAGIGSAKDPVIEHFILEYEGGQRPFDPGSDPVETAVNFAKDIALGK